MTSQFVKTILFYDWPISLFGSSSVFCVVGSIVMNDFYNTVPKYILEVFYQNLFPIIQASSGLDGAVLKVFILYSK